MSFFPKVRKNYSLKLQQTLQQKSAENGGCVILSRILNKCIIHVPGFKNILTARDCGIKRKPRMINFVKTVTIKAHDHRLNFGILCTLKHRCSVAISQTLSDWNMSPITNFLITLYVSICHEGCFCTDGICSTSHDQPTVLAVQGVWRCHREFYRKNFPHFFSNSKTEHLISI